MDDGKYTVETEDGVAFVVRVFDNEIYVSTSEAARMAALHGTRGRVGGVIRTFLNLGTAIDAGALG